MLGVCTFSVLGSCMRLYLCLFLFMAVRGLEGIRRMDKVPNARIRELCGMAKDVDERIEEDDLYWFSHVERMENDMIPKKLYIGEFVGSSSAGQPRKEEVM